MQKQTERSSRKKLPSRLFPLVLSAQPLASETLHEKMLKEPEVHFQQGTRACTGVRSRWATLVNVGTGSLFLGVQNLTPHLHNASPGLKTEGSRTLPITRSTVIRIIYHVTHVA